MGKNSKNKQQDDNKTGPVHVADDELIEQLGNETGPVHVADDNKAEQGESPIVHAFNTVLDATSLDDQVIAKRQVVIVLTNEVEKDASTFRIFFNLVKDTNSVLFGLEYGAIDEITYGVDAEVKAWNALVVIVNLIIEGGNLPFDKHGVKSQFTGNYEQLGVMLSKAITN